MMDEPYLWVNVFSRTFRRWGGIRVLSVFILLCLVIGVLIHATEDPGVDIIPLQECFIPDQVKEVIQAKTLISANPRRCKVSAPNSGHFVLSILYLHHASEFIQP